MRNICLTLSYDGTNFVGWQVQPEGRSVQAVVEAAILKLTGEQVRLTVAGRTDAGVHALGQVANFRTNANIPCKNIRAGLQSYVDDDIVIREAREVDESFHATYSAKRKRYRYVIYNAEWVHPFLRKYAHCYYGTLDDSVMHAAGQTLLGQHDFRCFESHYPNKATSVRNIMELSVVRRSGWPIWNQAGLENAKTETSRRESSDESSGNQRLPFICLDVVADGFLYNMVRAITGTLLEVGKGKWSSQDVRDIVEAQDRSKAGSTAPAQGLYLVHVDYEET